MLHLALQLDSIAGGTGVEPHGRGTGGDDYRALRADLGIPDEAITYTIGMTGRLHGPQWREYRADLFGIAVPAIPESCPWPYWTIEPPNGPIVQLWRRQVRWLSCPAYIEANWHPERGETVCALGLEQVVKIGEAKALVEGLKLLRVLDGRGRPSKVPRSNEAAKEEQRKVKRAIKKFLERGEAFNRKDVEQFVYAVEQGGSYLAKMIAPAQYNDLEAAVLRANPDLVKPKRRNVR